MGWTSLELLLLSVSRVHLPKSTNRPLSNLPLHKPINEKLELWPTPFRNLMAQRRQGKCGTVHHRNIIQGSNGFTINGGTYANGDASTTTHYNLLVINVNGSPSLNIQETDYASPLSKAATLLNLANVPIYLSQSSRYTPQAEPVWQEEEGAEGGA
ncbi:hypothetical protein BKA70DRAFT_1522101 [Coprinopsis sp. MPI-PUGE-AT-0042]|nr:hypothetical protein BKA70DRAFT_1522101 [Coprinopsis sp. MPI-PUGE-AT-0042]